jgi:glycosyltransferase involved in cell wall biosynthesis
VTRAATTKGDGHDSLSVAWAGPMPRWLELGEATAELHGVELRPLDGRDDAAGGPDIAHVTRAALRELRRVRKALPDSAVVLDLTGEGDTALNRRELRQAREAKTVLVGSGWELRELRRRLPVPSRTAALGRPLDLDWHAPEPSLAETKGRGRDLRRFRRFHRLAGPVVLFAGPFTEGGGLDVLVEAVFVLRERVPDLRFAAIPHGPTDERYRDRLEMRILGLGHHGLLEWSAPYSEIPYWYATAAVVCAPAREPVSPEPAKYAAAAARPFVGSNLEPFREHVEEGVTGRLVPAGDRLALERTIEELLEDNGRQARLGEAARRKAEAEYSPAAAARALRGEWEAVREELAARGEGVLE